MTLDRLYHLLQILQSKQDSPIFSRVKAKTQAIIRSPKTISEKLNKLADALQAEATAPSFDLFGEVPKRSK